MPISVEFVAERLSTIFGAAANSWRPQIKMIATRKHVTRWLVTQNTTNKIKLISHYDILFSFGWDCMEKQWDSCTVSSVLLELKIRSCD